jgi:hypothetical protein
MASTSGSSMFDIKTPSQYLDVVSDQICNAMDFSASVTE